MVSVLMEYGKRHDSAFIDTGKAVLSYLNRLSSYKRNSNNE